MSIAHRLAARLLAAAGVVATAAGAAATLLLRRANEGTWPAEPLRADHVGLLLAGLVLAVSGAVSVARRPGRAAGWLLLAAGPALVGTPLMVEAGIRAVTLGHATAAAYVAWPGAWSAATALTALGTLAPLLAARPHRRLLPLFALAGAAVGAQAVLWATTAYAGLAPTLAAGGIANPLADDFAVPSALVWALTAGAALASAAALALTPRRHDGDAVPV